MVNQLWITRGYQWKDDLTMPVTPWRALSALSYLTYATKGGKSTNGRKKTKVTKGPSINLAAKGLGALLWHDANSTQQVGIGVAARWQGSPRVLCQTKTTYTTQQQAGKHYHKSTYKCHSPRKMWHDRRLFGITQHHSSRFDVIQWHGTQMFISPSGIPSHIVHHFANLFMYVYIYIYIYVCVRIVYMHM